MHATDQRCAVYYCIRLLCFFSNLPLSLGRFLLHPIGIKLRRAFPRSKAHSAGFRATTQLTRLALSGPSLRRKRHESVMSNGAAWAGWLVRQISAGVIAAHC